MEASIPWAALGVTAAVGQTLRFRIQRCDLPKGGVRACGSTGAVWRVMQLAGPHLPG